MIPTKELDRRFPGVGRVRVASGTTHKPTWREMNQMLTTLYRTGRLDLLRAIRDRVLPPMRVYDAYRSNRLESLPTAEMLLPLRATWDRWLDTHEVREKTREGYKDVAIHLDAVMAERHTVEDLPGLLAEIRVKLASEGKAVTFNRLRSGCQAFARVKLGEGHQVWIAIKRVKPLKETAKRTSHPQTVAMMDALSFDKDVTACCWSMATTGMGPGELWGEWTRLAEPTRIYVQGTKADGRERVVPDLGIAEKPAISWNVFRLRLQKAARKAGVQLSAYDFRHTFATWMEDAQIPFSRLKSYMGHGPSNVTSIYLWREVKPYLEKDAKRLRAFLRMERAKAKAARKLTIVPGDLPGRAQA